MNHPGLAAALLTLLGPGWREISPVSGEDGPIGSLDDGRSDKTKARAVVRQLMGERLFSGWGVRTLAVGEGRYNPIGYHVGTIWPFDTPSSPGGCAAMASRPKRHELPRASWRPRSSSRVGSPRRSAATHAR